MTRRAVILLGVSTLSLVLLGSLITMSDAIENSARLSRLYVPLLLINAVGLGTFIVLIGGRIRGLIRDLRERRPGSRLTLRMLTIFASLAVTPVLLVYGFSLDFLQRRIDSWFDLRIERALADSLELSRYALDQRMRDLLKQTEQLAYEFADAPSSAPLDLRELNKPSSTMIANTTLPVDLDGLRGRSGADELVLLTREGGIVASSTLARDLVPNLPSEAILLQLAQGRNYIGLDPIRDATLAVRAVVHVPGVGVGADAKVLQALYPVAARINQLADNVQTAYAQYQELAYLRDKLKISFTMTLTLVLLFGIFSALWATFYSASRLTAPIRDLAEGTRAVARGEYGHELPVASQDEMGFLVESFNEMTRKIALASDEARQSREQVDTQRAYLEAVLGKLSSGVLTLDLDRTVRTANASASKILGIVLPPLIGQSLDAICTRYLYLRSFRDAVHAALSHAAQDWREQVVLFGAGGRQVLMCRGTKLSGAAPDHSGHVIVFDDITALLQGQRDAAWSEAARRLAHEIKNPLTPIQLSAERLRHKYLGTLAPRDAEVLDRLTHTIVQQVETMKGMVNTFSEYARAPQIQPRLVSMNQLINEVLDLYRSVDRNAVFETQLDPAIPETEADPARMRQVLNNLIKNAIEAAEGGSAPYVKIRTRLVHQASHSFLELQVEDRGPGIPPSMRDQLFEPYVTNKPKGTGLGLAIVKKIVEEHGGVVWLQDNAGPGVSAVIRLPLGAAGPAADLPAQIHRSAL